MKLRFLSFAVLLMASGLASAAPQLQTCQPMEVTHNGGAGLGYSLSCEAGGWKLNYKGSVPAGSASVLAQYRLSLTHPDGSNLVQTRTARLPDPSMLGQMLVREAVLLDNGDLALRECPEIGCTLYRPLGGDAKLAKASITVTPELARLLGERKQLADQVEEQATQIAALQARESALSTDLASARQELAGAHARHKAELLTLTDQQAADLAGLQSAHDAQLKTSAEFWKSGSQTQVADARRELTEATAQLNAKVDSLSAELTTVRQELQAARAELATANAKLAAEHTARQDLQAELVNVRIAQEKTPAPATQDTPVVDGTAALAAVQAELAKTQEHVKALSGALSATESALIESDKALGEMTAQRNAIAEQAKDLSETTLSVIDEVDAAKERAAQAEASKALAQKDAADLFTKLEAARLTQELSTQAANVAHMEVDSLNLQVRGLTAELEKALEVLASTKKVQAEAQGSAARSSGENEVLDGNLATQDKLIASLRAKLAESDKVIAELQARVDEHRADTTDAAGSLSAHLEACKASVSALETKNYALYATMADLQTKLADQPKCKAPKSN